MVRVTSLRFSGGAPQLSEDDWRYDAACGGKWQLFDAPAYAKGYEEQAYRYAQCRRVCLSCPVFEQCREFIDADEEHIASLATTARRNPQTYAGESPQARWIRRVADDPNRHVRAIDRNQVEAIRLLAATPGWMPLSLWLTRQPIAKEHVAKAIAYGLIPRLKVANIWMVRESMSASTVRTALKYQERKTKEAS